MTRPVSLNLPPLDFMGGGAGFRAALDLWSGILPPGFVLPDEVEFDEILWAMQAPDVVPAGFWGRCFLSVDPANAIAPNGYYCAESGYPASPEDAKPRSLNFAGRLGDTASFMLTPGMIGPFEVIHKLSRPLYLRRGDRLLVNAETKNTAAATHFQVFPILRGWNEDGRWPLEPGVVWAMPLNLTTGGGPFYVRSLIPNIPNGGSQVVVEIATLDQPCTLSHMSVGIQAASGSPNMAATPVPLLFNGQPGITLAAGSSVRATAALTTVAGQSLLVHSSIPSGNWACKNVSPAPSWWASSADSYNAATMAGTITYQPNRTHVVRCAWAL